MPAIDTLVAYTWCSRMEAVQSYAVYCIYAVRALYAVRLYKVQLARSTVARYILKSVPRAANRLLGS